MTRILRLPAVIMLCAGPVLAQDSASFVGAHGAMVPATYTGSIDGAIWRLDLWPDQAFHLATTDADGAEARYHAGRWRADADGLSFEIDGERVSLAVRNPQRLRPAGAPDDATGDLVTEGALTPGPVTLPAAGMFLHFADSAVFQHCATGLRHPVSQEGDYLAVETAYQQDRPGPEEPLFVTLDVTIDMREPMEGPARPTVIVDSFRATWPGEDCARAASAPTLTGAIWRLVELEGEAVRWAPPQNEPHIVFRAGEAAFNASVGCNTLRGGFEVDGQALRLMQGFATLIACPDDLATLEARLNTTLGAVESYAIGGATLRLLDEAQTVTAAFEAVYRP